VYQKTVTIHTLIGVIFFNLFLIINTLYAQKSYLINDIEYRLHNGKWYSYNGKLCNEVIKSRLIVRLKDKGKMENFNFNTLGLKNISLATKSFLGGFYVLSIPEEINSFEAAKKLEKQVCLILLNLTVLAVFMELQMMIIFLISGTLIPQNYK